MIPYEMRSYLVTSDDDYYGFSIIETYDWPIFCYPLSDLPGWTVVVHQYMMMMIAWPRHTTPQEETLMDQEEGALDGI